MLSNYIFAYKIISFTRGPKESVIAHLVFNFTTISRPARLVIFFIVLIETTVSRQKCHPTRTPDSEPTSLCSFSSMLRAQRRSNKYQFYSLWFDPNGARSTILKVSMPTIKPPQLLYTYLVENKLIFSISHDECLWVIIIIIIIFRFHLSSSDHSSHLSNKYNSSSWYKTISKKCTIYMNSDCML